MGLSEQLLNEAMELLGELSPALALFQRQRYGDLKRRYDQQAALPAGVKEKLLEIETEG